MNMINLFRVKNTKKKNRNSKYTLNKKNKIIIKWFKQITVNYPKKPQIIIILIIELILAFLLGWTPDRC